MVGLDHADVVQSGIVEGPHCLIDEADRVDYEADAVALLAGPLDDLSGDERLSAPGCDLQHRTPLARLPGRAQQFDRFDLVGACNLGHWFCSEDGLRSDMRRRSFVR